jgi:hypothetical protein
LASRSWNSAALRKRSGGFRGHHRESDDGLRRVSQSDPESEAATAVVLVSFPLVILIFIAKALRVIWFDAAYGFWLGFLLPQWLMSTRMEQ